MPVTDRIVKDDNPHNYFKFMVPMGAEGFGGINSGGLTNSKVSALALQPRMQTPQPMHFSLSTLALIFLEPGTGTISMASKGHLSRHTWQPLHRSFSTTARKRLGSET